MAEKATAVCDPQREKVRRAWGRSPQTWQTLPTPPFSSSGLRSSGARSSC